MTPAAPVKQTAFRARFLLLLVMALTLLAACQRAPDLPTYWQVPAFTLTDQNRAQFGTSELTGRVVLVDFIYTNCADICPILSATLRTIQDRLKAERLFESKVVLVSISVDPERDTPEVLAQYGTRFGADFGGWKFLSGSREELESTLLDGFKLPFRGPTPAGPLQPGFEITHTNRVILMDRQGTVRGLLTAEELDVEQTLQSIRRLVN